jgi:hypothetical protein
VVFEVKIKQSYLAKFKFLLFLRLWQEMLLFFCQSDAPSQVPNFICFKTAAGGFRCTINSSFFLYIFLGGSGGEGVCGDRRNQWDW